MAEKTGRTSSVIPGLLLRFRRERDVCTVSGYKAWLVIEVAVRSRDWRDGKRRRREREEVVRYRLRKESVVRLVDMEKEKRGFKSSSGVQEGMEKEPGEGVGMLKSRVVRPGWWQMKFRSAGVQASGKC